MKALKWALIIAGIYFIYRGLKANPATVDTTSAQTVLQAVQS